MAQYNIIGPKTPSAVRDRPKANPRSQNSVATPPQSHRTAAHRRLHSVRHRAARCARHRAQLMRTVAATCAQLMRTMAATCVHRLAAGASQHHAQQSRTVASQREQRIQLAVAPQQLRLRNHNFGLTHRIMVKRLAISPHDPLGIIDSACKNQSVVVSVQYGPFNTYIPIRSTTIGKSRVARDPITMHTSWRSNSDIACVTRRAVNLRQRSIDSYVHRDLTQSRHLTTPNESMLAGFTTEEAEADTVADQGLKRVNHIFGGLNEGIWPKTGGAHCIAVSLARWTVSEGTAQASCENVIWNRIYEVCWKKYRRRRCALERYQELLSAMMTSPCLLEKAVSSKDDVSIAD
ncbi:hypothetical protein F511_14882 [Dorcoceras hygrometricum]|uniref:Uncharacterized protein n=1 Tax=Dorcoceras hygrometricum TaxID=472368 RepID=A0A2Z7BT30_9LAMI|nr:hypothetical protein F511_14882 [Dorcoceras hygrometricum]